MKPERRPHLEAVVPTCFPCASPTRISCSPARSCAAPQDRYGVGGFLEGQNVTAPQDVQPHHGRAYLADGAARGVKDTTVHAHARAVKAFLRFLQTEGASYRQLLHFAPIDPSVQGEVGGAPRERPAEGPGEDLPLPPTDPGNLTLHGLT
jgi:hypothetical protein